VLFILAWSTYYSLSSLCDWWKIHEIISFNGRFPARTRDFSLLPSPMQWYRQTFPQNEKAGTRSWPHSVHLPHCWASEWVNIQLHSPYAFVPCKVTFALYYSSRFYRFKIFTTHVSKFAAIVSLRLSLSFSFSRPFCVTYYRHIVFFSSLCFSLFFPFFFTL